jgi:hypothetical protein
VQGNTPESACAFVRQSDKMVRLKYAFACRDPFVLCITQCRMGKGFWKGGGSMGRVPTYITK